MPADPAVEIESPSAEDQADNGPQGEQTPSDPAVARQPEAADRPAEGSDDSDTTSDPLVLAQMEPAAKAAPAKAEAPKTAPKQPAVEKPAAEEPKAEKPAEKPVKAEETKAEEPDDEAEALSDLPEEDWKNGVLSHKAKSKFLAQRKVIRSQNERLKAEAEARKQSEDRYQSVEKFVREQGLENEEYVNTVAIGGMIKRNDPRAIPTLEQTLANLRKATGQAEPPPPPPAKPVLDDELTAFLKEAEEIGLDTSKVRTRFDAPAAPKPAQEAKQEAAPAKPAQQPASVPGENEAIVEALMGLGIQPEQVQSHVVGLIKADPDLANVPPGQRLRAVLKAHKAAASTAPPVHKPATQPLSGRGRPQTGGTRTTATSDPLKLAMAPRTGR